jgi:hypothetical protein
VDSHTVHQILASPFTWGLVLGLIFAALALYQLFLLKWEMKRYKRHLSDKLEIEADSMKSIKKDHEALRKENENLRLKVASFNDLPDRKVQRDLEVFARAEKKMLISVPGFAPAWEGAKSIAHNELAEEEAGRSIPQRVFTKFFGAGQPGQKPEPEKVLTDRPASE